MRRAAITLGDCVSLEYDWTLEWNLIFVQYEGRYVLYSLDTDYWLGAGSDLGNVLR
jgi:hypothetical protein